MTENEDLFFEDRYGFLCGHHTKNETLIKSVVSEYLRPRVLPPDQFGPLAGISGKTHMNRRLSHILWSHMSAGVGATVRELTSCANNRACLIKKTRPMQRFPATNPLEPVAAEVL